MLLDLRSLVESVGNATTNQPIIGTARVQITSSHEFFGTAMIDPPTTFTSTQNITGIAFIFAQRPLVNRVVIHVPTSQRVGG